MSAKKNLKKEIIESFNHHLSKTLAKRAEKASNLDRYKALALSIRDQIVEKWLVTQNCFDKDHPKMIYYLSLEFLMGRALGNAMINLEVFDAAKQAMKELGFEISDIREEGVDAGLGNGGLGRLAACFLDSMATLELPSCGYGIRYDYGIFKQKIESGYQVEEPDNWLRNGNPWEISRPEAARVVKFYGHTEKKRKFKDSYRGNWLDTEDVLAMPYDTPIPGYKTDNVNTLRLWSARSLFEFNLSSFNKGDYINANLSASMTENITKVLYPNDNNYEGKELRLKQQYFLVSATLQDIIASYKNQKGDLTRMDEKISIQLNDTHPAMAIPEFMRIMIDEENFKWEPAWKLCQKVFSYTNHTLMSEALEKWPVHLMEQLLPRHLEIIYEINMHLLRRVANMYPGDNEKLSRMSLIEEGPEKRVRMAYMAIVGSNHVNGVAALHTELLKNGLFKDFYDFSPHKFVNVTNGITPRRWLCKANPTLSGLITGKIGDEWVKNLDKLKQIEKFDSQKKFQQLVNESKLDNKIILSNYIQETMGININTESMFDVQVKRLHEYKRQLLNAFHAISLYLDIKDNPKADFVPRTIMFGAKAAPGYYMAKLIIKFINNVADIINNDETIGDKLKVVFLPNYRVSLAEKIIPAADLSEQISLAGTEASGTGNMKFALNGALTIGTMDGANVEIHDAVGADNIFIFGLRVEEVEKIRREGYNPFYYIDKSPRLKRIIELVRTNFFSQNEPGIFNPLLDNFNIDFYMLAADFESYCKKQQEVSKLYKNKSEWTRKTIINIANMGIFSSDRTINDYASKIWDVQSYKVK